MAEQYITQEQAAIYSAAIGALSQPVANAYLLAASEQVDNFCGRRFDTVLEELPSSVAMAVALWAEEMTKGVQAGREISSERIGDYSVSFSTGTVSAVQYPCPQVVAGLLSAYRIIIVG